MIVVDASILANVVGDDSVDGRRTRSEIRSAVDVAAPDLREEVRSAHVEVHFSGVVVAIAVEIVTVALATSVADACQLACGVIGECEVAFRPGVAIELIGVVITVDVSRERPRHGA